MKTLLAAFYTPPEGEQWPFLAAPRPLRRRRRRRRRHLPFLQVFPCHPLTSHFQLRKELIHHQEFSAERACKMPFLFTLSCHVYGGMEQPAHTNFPLTATLEGVGRICRKFGGNVFQGMERGRLPVNVCMCVQLPSVCRGECANVHWSALCGAV